MRISYQRMYNVGLYLNERIGVEDDVPDGVDPMQVFHQLKDLCDKAHKELNPEEMQGTTFTTVLPRVAPEAPNHSDNEVDEITAREIEEMRQKIKNASSKAAAGQILFDSIWKHNAELKQLVNDKN